MSDDEDTTVGHERRAVPRHDIKIDVNYRHGDTYLFSRSSNLSELGIFVVSRDPAPVGTRMDLRFSTAAGEDPIELAGEVMWVVPEGGRGEPGMGIRFVDPGPDVRQRIQSLIRTMAFLE